MELMKEKDGESLAIVRENVEALKALFPDAFTESGIDFDALRQLLGDEIADGEEKYGLTWFGKKKARQIALTPSTGTLRPCPEESVDWETTQNLFIEGDNLEVLKLLQKSYAGKVKMIYIDPPYNTGKEFIYPDRYQDNLDTYLRYTGQKTDEGFKVSSETEGSGRFHTNWLSMMYPRLKLARSLLTEDGAIFISIDDNEQANLKKICDEIFGEENFVVPIIWQKRITPENRRAFSFEHDYIICYAKSADVFVENRQLLPLTDDARSRYRNPDNDPRGDWQSVPAIAQAGHGTKSQFYKLKTPDGRLLDPPPGCCWRYTQERMTKEIADNRIWFGADGKGVPRIKRFLNDTKQGITPSTMWSAEAVGANEHAKKDLRELFDGQVVFDSPKPIGLIERMLDICTIPGGANIVLDFFAGSSATAHAVISSNLNKGKRDRYIMVQLPEPVEEGSDPYKAGFRKISEIGMERARRVAKKIHAEYPDYDGDVGFKVFKLDSSNIRTWNPIPTDLEQSLLDHTEHLVQGRREEDVLYELLLKRGVDLTVPIESREIADKTVYSIGFGVLFACLDETIDKSEIEALGQGIIDWHAELEPASDTQVVFRDSAFADDIAKTNMTAILEQNGIAHVRSL